MKLISYKIFKDAVNKSVQFKMEIEPGVYIFSGYWEKKGFEKIISVSTQVGCKTQCKLFCNVNYFSRDLLVEEILEQINIVMQTLNLRNNEDIKISLVKEGEPLDNVNIVKIVKKLDEKKFYAVKISTSLPEGTEQRLLDICDIKGSIEIQLQISLSSDNEVVRNDNVSRKLLSFDDIKLICDVVYNKAIKYNKKYNKIALSFTIYEESIIDFKGFIHKYNLNNKIFLFRIRNATPSNGREYTMLSEEKFNKYRYIIEKYMYTFIDGRSEQLAVDHDLTIGIYKLSELL
ncbi:MULTISPECIES: hypothetical protein [Blautia]|uniref:hypothetical protein n=1 Tax=Blautia TaxID=572511 RepID=UPI000BA3BFD5|nr:MULTISPECIES: hypothetical protein [Blautia]